MLSRTSDLISLRIQVLHIEGALERLLEELLEHGSDHGERGHRGERKATDVVTQRDLNEAKYMY